MNIKKIIISIILISIIYGGVTFYVLLKIKEPILNPVEVNDIVQTLAEKWETIKQEELPGLDYELDYVVLDDNNHYLTGTRQGLHTDLPTVIKNRDTIIEVTKDHRVLGKLIIMNDTSEKWKQIRHDLFVTTVTFIIVTAMMYIFYMLQINRFIFQPFRRLKGFARQVASGNLEVPLEMDRDNIFGAFSESFDLMRSELKKARENERRADQSKKELVASLSHDIKTPISSIMAVAEVMCTKTKEEAEKKQLKVIVSKAEQINSLITNLFDATLEELQELKVTIAEQSSGIIRELIKSADYNNQVIYSEIPECIVQMDELRLSQVIDNIINNSYKYAGTSIKVSAQIQGKYLMISFQDFGHGVSREEKALIFNKYYRAKNAEGKSGAGLGLYISNYLMDKMSGEIDCDNLEDGFTVRLKLLIA